MNYKAYPYPYLSSIRLRNFRGFKDSKKLILRPLTFLVGPNSSGKSTISNAIMLLSQSRYCWIPGAWPQPAWDGRLVDLGSYEDTVYRHDAKLRMKVDLGFVWRNQRQAPPFETDLALSYCIASDPSHEFGRLASFGMATETGYPIVDMRQRRSNSKKYDIVAGASGRTVDMSKRVVAMPSRIDRQLNKLIFDNIKEVARIRGSGLRGRAAIPQIFETHGDAARYRHFFSGIQRVSSGRAAPKRWYDKASQRRLEQVAPRSSVRLDDAQPSMLFPDMHSVDYRRNRQISSIADLLKTLNIADTVEEYELSPYHTSIRLRDNKTRIKCNLIDVGFGASQVLPVLRAFTEPSYSPIFVEQPEVHLHPKAQSVLGDLFCDLALYRQAVVETHSEHLINKSRIAVAQGRLSPDSVSIIYVDRSRAGSSCTQIGLDDNGDFTKPWPDGFFDERYGDALELMAIQSRRS